MRQRKRSTDNDANVPDDDSPRAAGADLEDVRRSGQELAAAGDEIIGRALSRDSVAFLWANRQSSGQ